MKLKTNKKIKYDDIIGAFLRACAGADGYTDKKEIAEYIKNRKKDIESLMAKKGVK